MAKRPSSAGQAEHDRPAFNPFLKAPDVTKKDGGELFSITSGFTRRRPGQFGEQIIMEVNRKSDGKTFDFAIGVGSINHRILARRMGDEQRWRGELKLQSQDGTNGRPFVAVVTDSDEPPF